MSQLALRIEQQENLERVEGRIGRAIEDFIALELRSGKATFHANELRKWVNDGVPGVAPASPDRILRGLRQAGRINYEVVSRRNSLYRALPLVRA